MAQHLVGFGADGASVNMGTRKGVAARLREDYLGFSASIDLTTVLNWL